MTVKSQSEYILLNIDPRHYISRFFLRITFNGFLNTHFMYKIIIYIFIVYFFIDLKCILYSSKTKLLSGKDLL